MIDPLMITTDGDKVEVSVKSPDVISQDSVTPIQGFLNVDDPSPEERGHMQEVWDYLSQDSKLDSERLWKLQQLEIKLGQPKLGQNRLTQVYRYITLDRQIKADEKLRDGMLR